VIIPTRREVSIDCPRCRKPVSAALSIYGRPWELSGRADGGVTRENQMGGGLYGGDDNRPRWRSRVWDTSPAGRRAFDPETAAGGWARGDGRRKLICNRRHRDGRGRPTLIQRTVTRQTLGRVCEAAIGAAIGSGRVTWDREGGRATARVTLDDFR